MKNKEKFAKEIVEIACGGDKIAVTKKCERVVRCSNIDCSECLFECINCVDKIRKWAESEYIEKPVISKRDKTFLEYLDKKLKYIARDKNNILMAYEDIGKKDENEWEMDSGCIKSLLKLNVQFPMIKWEDDKPWLIEDLKKLEVVEEYD